MSNAPARPSADWLGSSRTNLLAWGLPEGAIVVGLLVEPPLRATVWVIALAWMGVACMLNARRCRRTHCRFTGPYYLAMILPVLAFALGAVAVNFNGWLALGFFILLVGKIIWWATERAWGKFS
jgi:hypothetical protein